MGGSEHMKLIEINSNIVYWNPCKLIATLNENSLNIPVKCEKYTEEKSTLSITLLLDISKRTGKDIPC